MQRILPCHNVFSPFIDLIYVFGAKINDDLVGAQVMRGYVSKVKTIESSPFLYGIFPFQ